MSKLFDRRVHLGFRAVLPVATVPLPEATTDHPATNRREAANATITAQIINQSTDGRRVTANRAIAQTASARLPSVF